MELEFDKEIDAILRKAGVVAAVDAKPKGEHIDVDAIAAFAENALPAKVKSLYTAHFADCGPCRTMLAQTMAWPPAEKKAAADVVAPVVASSGSWFASLFKTPNLALAMGALVLVFAGVLGFMVVRNRTADSNATVARIDEQEQQRSGPLAPDPGAMNTNAAIAANTTANVGQPTPGGTSNSVSGVSGTGTLGRGPSTESEATTTETVQPRPVEAMPPPAASEQPGTVVSGDAPKKGEDRRDEEKAKDDDSASRASKTQYDGMSRDAKKVSGPSRIAGPRLNQQNINSDLANQNMAGGAAATSTPRARSAAGKKFENRDGAWYDTAYRGQATKNINRGTEEFQKLDSGLRSIAASMSGVVVVVWKGTAYRIQ